MAALFNESQEQIHSLMQEKLPLDAMKLCNSVPLPNTAKPGFSPTYRNMFSPGELIETPHPSLNTVKKIMDYAAHTYGDEKCIGWRSELEDGTFGPYEWQTYSKAATRQRNFGAGLFFILTNNPYKTDSPAHLKIDDHLNQNGNDSFVLSIFSHNRPEWIITDMACVNYSITNTALYDSLGPEASKYILELTESPIVVCTKSKLEQVIRLKKTYPNELSNLISVVSMDPLDLSNPSSKDYQTLQLAKECSISLFDFNQVEKLGEIYPVRDIPSTPETIYTISFTSGTTGANPKGVVLTHRNAVSGTTFCIANMLENKRMTMYCFLPLAHIYQRQSIYFSIFQGIAIGFPQSSSPLSLLDDVKCLKPHVLALVPRVYTKLEAAIKAQTTHNDEKPMLKAVFSKAINKKIELQSQEDGAERGHIIYDRVLSLLRKKVGFDNLELFTSGSAPISSDTVKFIKAAFNTGLAQGYGSTESYAGIAGSLRFEANPGSCGSIGITTEMKLRDIPEMNYFSTDKEGPRGELLIRGPQIFKEYYKDAEETKKSKDEEGWFYTGDIARIDAKNGRLYIIDRVKNFFKLAQGEYITPEKIENNYLSSFPLIQQLYVHGDSLQTFVLAVVGVEPDSIKKWLATKCKILESELSSNDAIIECINKKENKTKFLVEMNKSTGNSLQGYEKVHNLYIGIEPLSIESNILTPTLKIRRPIASKYFRDDFDRLYEEGSLIHNNSSKF